MKQFTNLIVLLACCIMTSCMPLNGVTRSTENSDALQAQLASITTGVNEALDIFIRSYMDCTSVSDCKIESTSLYLENLPKAVPNENRYDYEDVFTENMNGLQDFNYYLQNAFGHEGAYGWGEFSNITTIMTDVTQLMSSLMVDFQLDMTATYCLDLDVTLLSEYPPCDICRNPSLPSRSLEIVRNYKFLMQLINYLNGFNKVYGIFLAMYPVPSTC